MSNQLYELRDMLMDELQSLTSKGELTAGSLDTVDKLTHSIKSIDTICAMEEAGEYSHDGMSYARGRRNVNRDSRGRYAMREGYSGHDKHELIEELRKLMDDTQDYRSKNAIQKAIKEMES